MSAPQPTPKSPDLALRRQYSNNQERIDGILETARRRSLAMANSGDTILRTTSRQSSSSPRNFNAVQSPESPSENLSGTGSRVQEDAESSADENTSIVRRDTQSSRNRDYLSMADSATLRSRHNNNGQANVRGAAPPFPRGADATQTQSEPAVTQGRSDGDSNQDSWWKRTFAKYKSIELENKGSVARDHLALERTFLAWLRTSLGFASIGIAVTQLFRLNTNNGSEPPTNQFTHLRQLGKPLGATFLAISILVLLIGFRRYFESQSWLLKNKFPASRGSIFLVALIAVLLMLTSLVVVLVIGPNSYEK